MATVPAKPGQTVDPTSLILLLLLPLLSGKQPDITQLLSTVLGGQTAAPGTAPSVVKPAPAQPAAPQSVNDIFAVLLPLLIQKITGQPLPVTTPVVSSPPADPPATSGPSVLTRPSVQIGAGALGISTILQALGALGMPFGMTGGPAAPSMTGTFATLIPLIISIFGATSGWGTLANVGSALIGGLANAANKAK